MARNSPENAMRFEFQVSLRPVQQITKKADIKKESPLRQSLVLSYQIQRLLDQGKIKSLSEAATWLNICNARISQILNLLCLAPEIQNKILQSEGLEKVTEYHIRWIAMEADWKKQMKMWLDLKK